MRTVLLASMRRHTRRYVAAAVAVVIGVSFVVTTNLLASSARAGMVSGLDAPYAEADVVVSGIFGAEAQTVLDLATDEGASASFLGWAWLPVSLDGRQLADRVDIGSLPDDERMRWQELVDGRFPERRGEAVVDDNRARATGVTVGDVLTVGSGAEALEVEVVGTVDSPSVVAGSGVYLTANDFAPWIEQTWLNNVAWSGTGSVGDQIRHLEQAVPEATVQTVDAFVDDEAAAMSRDVDAISMLLLLFAAIAFFVSVMVIANTFSILFAQRQRDFALLRCVGATRRQVLRSIRLEALVLGITASAAGLLLGSGLGVGIIALVQRVAPNVPLGTASPSPLWYGGALLVGVVVTLVAAWLPTRRVVRVNPLAALRPDVAVDARTTSGRLRIGSGALLVLAGIALLVLAIGSTQVVVMLAGGAAAFTGVLLLGPVLVPAAIRGAGRLTARSSAGRLATGNAVRHPRRTAATTASLLVGVTLTAAVLTGLASSRAAIAADMDHSYPLDATVTATEAPFDADLVDRVAGTAGVAAAVAVPGARGELAGIGEMTVLAPGPDVTTAVRGADHEFTSPAPGEVFVRYDELGDLEEAQTVTLTIDGETRELTVRARDGWGPAALVAPETLAAMTSAEETHAVWVRADPRTDADDLNGDLGAIASPDGGQTSGGLSNRNYVDLQLDVLTGAVAGLLGIAVVIALIGIGNTLGLSVLERARENALLRALGLTRRQLRATLAREALLLSGVASALGVALGVAFAWVGVKVMVAPIAPAATLTLPWWQLAVVVVAAGAAGLLASVMPSRTAARVTPAAGLALE